MWSVRAIRTNGLGVLGIGALWLAAGFAGCASNSSSPGSAEGGMTGAEGGSISDAGEADGRVAITGSTSLNPGSKSTTLLFDADGEVLWTAEYSHHENTVTRAVAFTPDGGVAVAGITYRSGGAGRRSQVASSHSHPMRSRSTSWVTTRPAERRRFRCSSVS